MRKILVIGTMVLVASFILSACQAGPGPVTRDFSIIMGEGEIIQEVDGEEMLTGEFHRWEPAVLVANVGDTIRLEVTNPRGSAHSFILPEFGVVTPRLEKRGGTATVEFTLAKAGIYQFACGLPQDDAAGNCDADHKRMVGYFIVLE